MTTETATVPQPWGYLVNFNELSLTLHFAFKAHGPGNTSDLLAWIMEQLNAKPEFAEVTARNVDGWLGWPDIVDAPHPAEEADPDAPPSMIGQVEEWLKLDRKGLVQALLMAEDEKASMARELQRAQKAAATYKEAHDLFEKVFSQVNDALARGDLSQALFPRVGDEARIELQTRQSQMKWVLEMLPAPVSPMPLALPGAAL